MGQFKRNTVTGCMEFLAMRPVVLAIGLVGMVRRYSSYTLYEAFFLLFRI